MDIHWIEFCQITLGLNNKYLASFECEYHRTNFLDTRLILIFFANINECGDLFIKNLNG